MSGRTRVLLVDDSRAVVAYVTAILAAEPDFAAPLIATTGPDGLRAALGERPDVVLLDLQLPGLDGLAVIREIMAANPCPIVVFSGILDSRDRDFAFEALQAGAVDVLAKPRGITPDEIERFRHRLVRALRVMTHAQVVRRWRPPPLSAIDSASPPASNLGEPAIVVVGASTGGPAVLFEILAAVPAPLPVPMVIAQHIVPGFESGLAQWLSRTGHAVSVAKSTDAPRAGHIFLAPADANVAVFEAGFEFPMPASAPTPSVDVLFESAAVAFGERTVAVLLTGMGADGARGMAALHRCGATTIAQSGETCVVDGMPKSARDAGSVRHNLTPVQIARVLHELAVATAQKRGPANPA